MNATVSVSFMGAFTSWFQRWKYYVLLGVVLAVVGGVIGGTAYFAYRSLPATFVAAAIACGVGCICGIYYSVIIGWVKAIWGSAKAKNTLPKADDDATDKLANGANRHIVEYLDYFLSNDGAVNFAVMITAPWGAGKTYFTKAYMRSRTVEKNIRFLYVSLYGLKTSEEVYNAIFYAAYPQFNDPAVRLALKIAKTGLKLLVDPPELTFSEFAQRLGKIVVIFDDLERSGLKSDTLLGIINQFVEHDVSKVIIVANETEELTTEEYLKTKEKVVGKTFHLRPSVPDAIDYFTASISDEEFRGAFCDIKYQVIEDFSSSKYQNFRLLYQFISDFERIYKSLSAEFRTNKDALVHISRLIMIWQLELRAGTLREDDLTGRKYSYIAPQGKAPPIRVVSEKYRDFDLADTILTTDVLYQIVISSELDVSALNECVGNSSYFLGTDEPAWRTLWYSFHRDESARKSALQDFRRQFQGREFLKNGEILHAYGIMIWLGKVGEISDSNVVEECKKYTRSLYNSKRIDATDPDSNVDEGFGDGAYGLRYQEADSAEFLEVANDFKATRRMAFKDTLPIQANDLLTTMTDDPVAFWRMLNYNNYQSAPFATIPILKYISPNEMAHRILSMPPGSQQTVFSALGSRYNNGEAFDRELADEKDWLRDLYRVFTVRAEESNPIEAARLRYLMSLIDFWSEEGSQDPNPF